MGNSKKLKPTGYTTKQMLNWNSKRGKSVLTTAKWLRNRFPQFSLNKVMKMARFLHGQSGCFACGVNVLD